MYRFLRELIGKKRNRSTIAIILNITSCKHYPWKGCLGTKLRYSEINSLDCETLLTSGYTCTRHKFNPTLHRRLAAIDVIYFPCIVTHCSFTLGEGSFARNEPIDAFVKKSNSLSLITVIYHFWQDTPLRSCRRFKGIHTKTFTNYHSFFFSDNYFITAKCLVWRKVLFFKVGSHLWVSEFLKFSVAPSKSVIWRQRECLECANLAARRTSTAVLPNAASPRQQKYW